MEKKKFNSFSVPLGLLDYINPIFYTVTMVTSSGTPVTPWAAPGAPCC